MELHLKVLGFTLILLALIHLFFPRYFKWKQDLKDLVLINRQMMYIHTFFIAFVVLLIGLLCLTCAPELIHTRLGGRIALGLFIFWVLRLLVQFLGYSPMLWRGKKMETLVHVLFSVLWIYVSTVFFIVYWTNDAVV